MDLTALANEIEAAGSVAAAPADRARYGRLADLAAIMPVDPEVLRGVS